MPFPPDVYLIGAQKSGTTALAEMLEQHPDVCVSTPKEPHFFSKHWDKGMEWYASHFQEHDKAVLIDASTTYTMARLDLPETETHPYACVPRRIHAVSPGAKLIYVVRDPVRRTYSAYWHTVRTGNEKRPFRQAIEQNPVYLHTSNYFGQVERYLSFFPLNSFLILQSEEVARNPQSVLERCWRFLGISDVRLDPQSLYQTKNVSFQYTSFGRWIRDRFASNRRFEGFLNLVKTVAPGPIRTLLARSVRADIPDISREDREYLKTVFAESERKLQALVPGSSAPTPVISSE